MNKLKETIKEKEKKINELNEPIKELNNELDDM